MVVTAFCNVLHIRIGSQPKSVRSFCTACMAPPSLPDSAAVATTSTAAAGVCTAPLEAAHAVVQAAPKQLDGQPLRLDHCQLEGVTLEAGAQVGVDGTTHSLNDLQSQHQQQQQQWLQLHWRDTHTR